jgi:hypothetical protein
MEAARLAAGELRGPAGGSAMVVGPGPGATPLVLYPAGLEIFAALSSNKA